MEMIQIVDGRFDLVDDGETPSDDDPVRAALQGNLPLGKPDAAGKGVLAQIFFPLLTLNLGMELRAHLHGLLVVDAVVDVAPAQQKVHELVDGQGKIALLRAHSTLFPDRPLAPFRKLRASISFFPSI